MVKTTGNKMENKKCYTCGSDEIVLDDSTSESQLVCTSCGTVLQECSSLSAVNIAGTSYISSDGFNAHMPVDLLKRNLTHNVIAPGKKQGLEKISQLANIFNFSEHMLAGATHLFSNAYNQEFRKGSIAKKIILAACCVYVVMRENDRKIVFDDLFKYLECRPKQFFSVFKRFEKNRNMKVPQQTIDDFVVSVLKDVKIDNTDFKISRKTARILKLCYECWVSSGRSRRHVVIAATYIAWISSDFTRRNVKFFEFYSKFSFPKEMYRTAALRVRDMYSVFVKHAQQLPWLKSSNVNSKNIFLHIDDVLEYFKSLHDGVLSEAGSSDCTADIVQYKELRPESQKQHDQYCEILGRGSDHQNLDNACSDYISDTEIDSYIRTEAEISKYCKLMDSIRAARNNSLMSKVDSDNISDAGNEK